MKETNLGSFWPPRPFPTIAPPLSGHNDNKADDDTQDDDDFHRDPRRRRHHQCRDPASPLFSNNGVERCNSGRWTWRTIPKTKTTTRMASQEDCSANGVVVVELQRSQSAPAPTSRDSTAGPIGTTTMAKATSRMSGMAFVSMSSSQDAMLRPWGVLRVQVSAPPLPLFL